MVIVHAISKRERVSRTYHSELPVWNIDANVAATAEALGIGSQEDPWTVHVLDNEIWNVYPAQDLIILRVALLG